MLNLVFCGEETSNRPGEIQHHPAFKGELLYSEGFGRLQHGGAESHIRIFGKVLPNWWKKTLKDMKTNWESSFRTGGWKSRKQPMTPANS